MTGCALSGAAWPAPTIAPTIAAASADPMLRSQGNIILADCEHKILSLLRAHKHDSTASASMVVGQPYPIEQFSQIKPFDVDELIANLEKGVASGDPPLKQHLSMTTGVLSLCQKPQLCSAGCRPMACRHCHVTCRCGACARGALPRPNRNSQQDEVLRSAIKTQRFHDTACRSVRRSLRHSSGGGN